MRWGLIPYWWEKPVKQLPATFNARAESVADKPMFRDAFKRHRCIIQASGYPAQLCSRLQHRKFAHWKRGCPGLISQPHPEAGSAMPSAYQIERNRGSKDSNRAARP
jgi:hypothetical protein